MVICLCSSFTEKNIGTTRYGSMYWHKLIGKDESVMVW